MTFGWSEIQIGPEIRKIADIDVYEGSCRSILSHPDPADRGLVRKASLFYRIFPGELDKNITRLIEDSMLCGSEDYLPGLQGSHLPNFKPLTTIVAASSLKG